MDGQALDWQSANFRQTVVEKIEGALQSSGVGPNRSVADMEAAIFAKSRSREEYMMCVNKLIVHFKNSKNKKQPEAQGIADPLNALQNLAGQGSRPMPPQMMGMNNVMGGNAPNPNANVLQNLIHQRPNQQQMQGMPNMGGIRQMNPQVMPGNMQNAGMNPNAMTLGNVINQPSSNAPTQMQGNMVTQMNQMGNQMPINVQGNQMNPINNMMSMNMNQGPNQMAPNQLNAGQMNQNQMMMNRMTAPNIGPHPGGPNAPQMMSQIPGNPVANTVPGNMLPNQPMTAGANPNQLPPNQMPNAGQMSLNQMLNPMSHMGRNQPPPPNVLYQVRNTTPNQQFFRKSPSPSAPSPIGSSHPNQMVPSPALVPSPQVPMPTRNVMAPSPSSTNLNTPGQTGAAPSPLNPQEEQLYREKYRQLTKYIEPLKKMVARIGQDDEKLLKMNKLLEILSNPSQRIPLDTLKKCEIALEKMDFKSYSMAPTSSSFGGSSKEDHSTNVLLEAVSNNLQSPIGNHTLQRTFRPCLEAMFGPDIKNFPPAKRARTSSASESPQRTQNEVPHLLKGEIARLDPKFHVSLDPSSQLGTKSLKLLCTIDDRFLPCVPPLTIIVPSNYPVSSPSCHLVEDEYTATAFLSNVQKALLSRLSKLPKQYSLSHLLDTWEMAIRQACSPSTFNTNSSAAVLLGA